MVKKHTRELRNLMFLLLSLILIIIRSIIKAHYTQLEWLNINLLWCTNLMYVHKMEITHGVLLMTYLVMNNIISDQIRLYAILTWKQL